MNITITLNGKEFTADVPPRTLLVHFIRETANLTGTHIGCDSSNCGACTVLVDGTPIKSCTYLAAMAQGKTVQTVEGLKQGGKLHPIQEQFREQHALQCGYCTPGMMLTGKSIIERYPNPTEEQIRWEISGQLCRCTGYQNIVKAIQAAAAVQRGETPTVSAAHPAPTETSIPMPGSNAAPAASAEPVAATSAEFDPFS